MCDNDTSFLTPVSCWQDQKHWPMQRKRQSNNLLPPTFQASRLSFQSYEVIFVGVSRTPFQCSAFYSSKIVNSSGEPAYIAVREEMLAGQSLYPHSQRNVLSTCGIRKIDAIIAILPCLCLWSPFLPMRIVCYLFYQTHRSNKDLMLPFSGLRKILVK